MTHQIGFKEKDCITDMAKIQEKLVLKESYPFLEHIEKIAQLKSVSGTPLQPDEIKKAKQVLSKMNLNSREKTIVYELKEYGVGRTYSTTYGCLCNMSKPLRRLTLNNKYKLLDMKSAQQNFLIQVCKKVNKEFGMNIPYNYIQEYIDNKQKILKNVSEFYGVDKPVAKELFQRLTFGGEFDSWRKECKLAQNHKESFVNSYSSQMLDIIQNHALHFGDDYILCLKIASEIKGKKDKALFRGAMGLFLQNLERKNMTVAIDWLRDNDYKVLTKINDAVLVDDCKEIDDKDIKHMEQFIKQNTGYASEFQIENTEVTKDDQEIWESIQKAWESQKGDEQTCWDAQFSENILEHFTNKIYKTDLGLMWYDDDSGLWSNDKNVHYNIGYRTQTIWGKDIDQCEKGKFCKAWDSIYKNLCCNSPVNDDFDSHNNDIGFLLFTNGVLDMNTHTILDFDPSYHFTKRINKPYDPDLVNDSDVKDVMDRIFKKAFTNHEKMDYFLQKIARGIAGCTMDREFTQCVGDTSCGKGKIADLLQNAFGACVGHFNTESLLTNKNKSADNERDWMWGRDIYNCRIGIGSECNMSGLANGKTAEFNSNLLKRWSGGVDKIRMRRLHENAILVLPKCNLFLFVNDLPSIDNCDDAYLKRCNIIEFDRCSSTTITVDNSTHFVADDNIDDYVKGKCIGDAMIKLICEYYQKPKMPKPDCVIQSITERTSANNKDLSWILNNYDIVDDDTIKSWETSYGTYDWNKVKDNYVEFNKCYNHYQRDGNSISTTAFGRMLTKSGYPIADKKIGSKKIKVRVGLKLSLDPDSNF